MTELMDADLHTVICSDQPLSTLLNYGGGFPTFLWEVSQEFALGHSKEVGRHPWFGDSQRASGAR